MFDIHTWVNTLTSKLKDAFGARLLFVGLQGSYRRGEAHAGSDIDVVVILDTLAMDDLKTYRAMLADMPDRDKACGFVGDRQALMHWPRHELFQFEHDTRPLHGDIRAVLPEITRADIADSVKIGASGLYHAACHSFVHSEAGDLEALKGCYKGAFFILQAVCYLRGGIYAGTKKELLPLLTETERGILEPGIDWDVQRAHILAHADEYYGRLIAWSAQVLETA